ncbi:MAG TPA: decaprenyl-phosphate phosphoribosyltransferase [Candidatus Manganitrophaceae bacterium]|nr:decaprenyl-phosphate phosphoribosyltransferase [Candidatus Manganitrophaceae bacterium]
MNRFSPERIAAFSAPAFTLKSWVQALRVKHWIKNFFVLAPFLVGPPFGINEFLFRAIEGTILFCLMSSAVYLFNDIVDLSSDRAHPEKRLRPIASGRISPAAAGSVSLLLFSISLFLAVFLGAPFLLILAAYAINNMMYTFYLKKKTVLDVMSIASGFVMRVYAGGFLVGIEITHWLIVSVFSLSLLLGFGKRRSEYEDLQEGARKTRKVHESYSIPKLNLLLGISASITIVTYMLYALSPETKARGADNIIFTTPFVVYCIYRFLLKVQEERRGEPVELILNDRGFVFAGLLWLVSILYLMH